MNRRLLVVTGVLLCAIIGSAAAFTVRNRAAGKVAPNRATIRADAPQSGAVATSVSPDGLKQQDGAVGIVPPTAEVPDYVVYGHLFHYNNIMLQRAQAIEALGQDASSLRNALKSAAKLDDTQTLTFNQIAATCEQDVKAIDDQARVIVANFRAQHPGGVLQPGEELPPPPQELQALQQQRNDTILAARDQLQQAFGEAAFSNFQTFVQQRVTPQIKRQPLDSLRPAAPASSLRPSLPKGEQRQPRGTPKTIKQ